MTDNSKLIQDWQDKVKHSFDDEGKLHDYLLHTIDNFLYRYLETSIDKDLKTQEIAPFIYGAHSFESNMVQALKITNLEARNGIKELAKAIPKSEGPKVKYTLEVQLKEFGPERGHLVITAIVNWDFPHYTDRSKMMKKDVEFKYKDIGQFRKELALRLESACELFS